MRIAWSTSGPISRRASAYAAVPVAAAGPPAVSAAASLAVIAVADALSRRRACRAAPRRRPWRRPRSPGSPRIAVDLALELLDERGEAVGGAPHRLEVLVRRRGAEVAAGRLDLERRPCRG